MEFERGLCVGLCILLVLRCMTAQDPAPNVIDALAGLKTQLNTVNSTADLTCESSQMMVNLTFAQPFFGKVFLENSPDDQKCWLMGNGLRSYRYPVPLKECGTRQISLREFENTLQIRFGNTPDIALADERKTILCRYPPPVVPPILPIPPPVAGAIPPVPVASVSELELLLIIAAVLFLGLLLLGLCCAWWCCKRRRAAKIVEGEGILTEAPDVMKLSGTTELFAEPPITIPRVTTSTPDLMGEDLLINRLGGEDSFPIVPLQEDLVRIPKAHVAVGSKDYEVQEAEMKFPPSMTPGSEMTEGEQETKETVTDRETEHIAIFAPPIPVRPPSPVKQRDEYERETVSDLTELETIHTLIAGRVPPRPPSPVRSEPYDMRSMDSSGESIVSSRSVIPMPPPVLPIRPPLKSVTTEMETETHSVVESLENELILRAVPKRQPRLIPPPQRQYYPLDTRTETTVVEETLERTYPPPGGPTMRNDRVRREELRRPDSRPPPRPETTTTTTVKETNITRDIEVYPENRQPTQPTIWQQDDRRESERYQPEPSLPRGPQTTTTRTTRETDILREYDIQPPPVRRPAPVLPPTTTTTTRTETDVRRDYEIVRPPPKRPPPSDTTTTRIETDVRREYEIVRPPVTRPPPTPTDTTTTTRTTRATDIRREYDVHLGPRYPGDLPYTITTDERMGIDSRSPDRPFSPEFVNTTTTTATERNVRRDFEVYPGGPRFQPPVVPYTTTTESTQRWTDRPPYGPIGPDSTTTTRLHRETNIRRDYDYRGLPHPRDGSISPDYPDNTTRTTEFRQDVQRNRDYPSLHEPSTYVSTMTRDVQKEIDAGTPPEGSGPPSETSPDDHPVTRTVTTTNVTRDHSMQPSTAIPRPVLREPLGVTTTATTATTTTRIQTDLGQFPEATPTYRPFNPSYPAQDTRRPRPSTRNPVNWESVYEVIYDEYHHSPNQPILFYHSLPEEDVERLRDLIIYDEDFQTCITRVRTVYDLYYIRYSPPFDTYFVETTWTVIIRIFVIVLDLPHPHPDDSDFIEPQPEWFAGPMNFGSHDRSSTGSSATPTNSFAERALSELTEDIPRLPARSHSDRSDVSDAGSSEFGSVVRRGSTEYSASERSVQEYFEDVPGVSEARTYRAQTTTRRGGPANERDEPMSEL